MAYRWRQDGPAFEFPTPYGIENRFLIARAVLLMIAAVAGLVLSALAGSYQPEQPVVVLEKLPDPGSPWPLVLAAAVMLVAAALNLLQALRQGQLLLQPGQPASLAGEVSREASGAGAGAPALLQDVVRGLPSAREPAGPWAGLCQRLVPGLGSSPSALQVYVAARIAHALLALGLGISAAVLMAWPHAGGAALGALLLLTLGALVALRHALDPDHPALTPMQLGALLALGALGAAGLGLGAGVLPILDKLDRFNLPLCALAMAACVLTIELMGLLAARPRVEAPLAGRTAHEDAEVAFDAHPAQLLREIDRELGRRWTDGVPSRRYIWQVPKIDAAAEEGAFSAAVLEETQPTSPPGPPAPARIGGLWVLGALGVLLTVAGAALWLRSAWLHLPNAALPWDEAGLGAVAVFTGGWALRVAHGLWSRIEVESIFTWLELKGGYYRLPGAAAALAGDAPGWSRGEPAVGVEDLVLRSCVMRVRSVFYADGVRGIGSRVLRTMAADPVGAAVWPALARGFAQKLGANPAAATPAALAARAKAHARRVAEAAQPATRRGARFCQQCGTPVLAGARFCQQCGHTLVA